MIARTTVKGGDPTAPSAYKATVRLQKRFRIGNRKQLYLMLLAPMLVLLIFSYLPMAGLVVAFQDYNIFEGLFGSPWVGFAVFDSVFQSPSFWQAFANTLMLNVLNLLVGFPAPIILALLLNELRSRTVKKVFQSTLYLPHFLSWAIIGALALQLFADNTGLVNDMFRGVGLDPVPFLSEKWHWLGTYLVISVWQSAGWGTIIYLSALTAINPDLYEASSIDGAGRWRQMWYITLPSISPTMIVLLILQVGRIVSIGFEQPYILGNDLVRDFSSVLSTYVYQMGIVSGQYSVATAVGLFQSITGLVLVLGTNALARRFGEKGLW